MNAPQYYVIHILPVFFSLKTVAANGKIYIDVILRCITPVVFYVN